MTINYWLLLGHLIIKVVAYATHQVFCQAPSIRVSRLRFEELRRGKQVSGVGCQERETK